MARVAAVGAGAVGFSRVYLGHHYPADVVAGYLIGILLGLLIAWVLRRSIIFPET